MMYRLIYDREADRACLYCDTTGKPFGPVWHDDDCDELRDWLDQRAADAADLRTLDPDAIRREYAAWQALPVCEWCYLRIADNSDDALCAQCQTDYHDSISRRRC